MRHEIEIKQLGPVGMGTQVYADGKEIHGIRSIQYDVEPNSVGAVTFEIIPERCNIQTLADVELTVDIDSLHTAIKCIQFEMKLNNDFKKSVHESAKSVLTESGITNPIADGLADMLIDRIFFGELP